MIVKPLPAVKLPARKPLSPTEQNHIRSLIRHLAEIDSPDMGLSPTMSGTSFAAVAGSGQPGAMVLMTHKLRTNNAVLALVKIGPSALPLLLESLSDPTPTRLTIKLEGILMSMEFHREVYGNIANPREAPVLRWIESTQKSHERPLAGSAQQHTITVGDVCFVIIGQITGRGYQAARYQPSGGMVINSPTGDPEIARAVREIWSGGDPTKTVFHSLIIDHSSRGVRANDYMKDTVGRASYLQTNAAMRLLCYFPREAAPIVATRLRSLDVRRTGPSAGIGSTGGELDRYVQREDSNGVTTTDYLRAVNWCRLPQIRRELALMFRRTEDVDILLLTASALDVSEWALVKRKITAMLHRPSEVDDERPLVVLYHTGGARALPIYRKCLRTNRLADRFTICAAIRQTRGEWDRELLYPLLNDKRGTLGYAYNLDENHRLPIRVCDCAAEVIAFHRRDVHFVMEGSYANLDRQIAVIKRKRLAATRE
jgi:hypothetical protein